MLDVLYIYKFCMIITVCVSFYIIVFSATLSKDNITLKYEGLAFLIPLSFATAVILLENNYSAAAYLSLSCELVSFFLIFISIKWKKLLNLKLYIIIILISIATLFSNGFILSFYSSQVLNSLVNFVLIMAAILLYALNKDSNSLRLSALLISSIGNGLLHLTEDSTLFYFLSMVSYIFYLIYFYQEINCSLVEKIDDVEKKINVLEKQLNYEVKKRTLEIERANERLVSISKCDSLTGIYNKKAILFEAEKIIFTKPNAQFCILIFDIDNFKNINDTFGHIEGDNCILKAVDIVRSCLNEHEKIGRFGGDEFVVILPNTNLQQGINVADRIRRKIMDTSNPRFTVSIGITSYPEDGNNVKDLVLLADKGLYKSKHYGRNYVSHANHL